MTALVNYRRLLDGHSNYSKPTKSIYLADLDALFHGNSHEHLKRVMTETVFELLRILHSFVDGFKDLIILVETALDRECSWSDVFDRSLEQYLRRRIKGQSHKTAIAGIKMKKSRGDDNADWVDVAHPEELTLQGLHAGDHSQPRYSSNTLLNMDAEYVPTQ